VSPRIEPPVLPAPTGDRDLDAVLAADAYLTALLTRAGAP